MALTTEWMAANFAKFNQQYFGARLPTPQFVIINSTKILGQCGARNWRAEHPRFVLKLNSRFIRTEYNYRCTLLHEMIHLYFQSNKDWNEGHGEKFVRLAMKFRTIGWNISIPIFALANTNNNKFA